jgi:hypothetical protein
MPLRRLWTPIAKASAWLTALIATFVLAPPALSPTEDQNLMLRLAQFVLAVLIGLFFLRPAALSSRTWRWLSIGFLAAGIGLFFGYDIARTAWSCTYDVTSRLVTGSDSSLSALALADRARYPGLPCERLLMDAGGHTEQLWPESQLLGRYIAMCGLYTTAIFGFAVAALSMIQFLDAKAHEDKGGRP